jgi:hypothetical protein
MKEEALPRSVSLWSPQGKGGEQRDLYTGGKHVLSPIWKIHCCKMEAAETVAGGPVRVYSHEEGEKEVCRDILNSISVCHRKGNVEKHGQSLC